MERISIRVGYGPYLLAGAVLATLGSTLIRVGAAVAGFACWAAIAPLIVVAILDRIEISGGWIRRRGPLAFILSRVFRVKHQISITDIETISTECTSLNYSGGDARLLYRTRVSGGGIEIVVRSRRSSYVPFIRALFHAAGPEKLDPRSHELYEYFEAGGTLENPPVLRSEISSMPVNLLRGVANSLRLAGRLAQASSYFRIAYEKDPKNPGLLYEMSRFLQSSAQVDDVRLLQRSDACLRLASRLAGDQPGLLERIGEAFFERLDYKRATECFQRALTLDPNRFRANIGLAEIALRDGKLAHVAHFYNAAAGAGDNALSRMARREAQYYERLVSDEDFLEAELRRIRVSNQLRWLKQSSTISFFLAVLVTALSGEFFPLLEGYGFALMGMTALVWGIAAVSGRFFRRAV